MRDIKGHEGRYAIEEDGSVWSYLTKKYLSARIGRGGYPQVCLCINGKGISFFVHRLVALTFIDNPQSLPQVNHMDGNRRNHAITNLEWCTQSQNAQHAYKVLGVEGPWKGKKRPEIKQWLNPYQKGNEPWNKGVAVGGYIPRKRDVVTDPRCPQCGIRNRWSIGRFPDGLKRYPKKCDKCTQAMKGGSHGE